MLIVISVIDCIFFWRNSTLLTISAGNSVGQSSGLLIRQSWVRIPPGTPLKEVKMRLDLEETILLTAEDIERINEICDNPPKPTKYMLEAARRCKEVKMRLDPEENVLTTVRESAYNTAIQQLNNRTSIAETLTEEQLKMIEQDYPYHIGEDNETKT